MSGLIPQIEIDRANDDIVSVVQGYVPTLKKTGKNWSACCPFHQEKSASFTVSAEKQIYYCFGCGAGGNAIGFVIEHQGLSFPDAVKSILGEVVRDGRPFQRKQPPKAIACSLPGHAEDREKSALVYDRCEGQWQHPYFMRNNTAPHLACAVLKKLLIVPIINNIGEQVNLASVKADGAITYAAGNPSFGSTAILQPADLSQHDGKTIICIDYAHAWRLWWSQLGKSRVLCTMEYDNFNWMLANCKDRFTHIGCDPSEADHHADEGRAIIALPLDPYAKVDRRQVDNCNCAT